MGREIESRQGDRFLEREVKNNNIRLLEFSAVRIYVPTYVYMLEELKGRYFKLFHFQKLVRSNAELL
jgi:hypothetical protein